MLQCCPVLLLNPVFPVLFMLPICCERCLQLEAHEQFLPFRVLSVRVACILIAFIIFVLLSFAQQRVKRCWGQQSIFALFYRTSLAYWWVFRMARNLLLYNRTDNCYTCMASIGVKKKPRYISTLQSLAAVPLTLLPLPVYDLDTSKSCIAQRTSAHWESEDLQVFLFSLNH